MTEENRDLDTESQGPEQDTDAGPAIAEDGDGGSPEEPDRERFPVEEDIALTYVADNKYAYGPRLSKVRHGMARNCGGVHGGGDRPGYG